MSSKQKRRRNSLEFWLSTAQRSGSRKHKPSPEDVRSNKFNLAVLNSFHRNFLAAGGNSSSSKRTKHQGDDQDGPCSPPPLTQSSTSTPEAPKNDDNRQQQPPPSSVHPAPRQINPLPQQQQQQQQRGNKKQLRKKRISKASRKNNFTKRTLRITRHHHQPMTTTMKQQQPHHGPKVSSKYPLKVAEKTLFTPGSRPLALTAAATYGSVEPVAKTRPSRAAMKQPRVSSPQPARWSPKPSPAFVSLDDFADLLPVDEPLAASNKPQPKQKRAVAAKRRKKPASKKSAANKIIDLCLSSSSDEEEPAPPPIVARKRRTPAAFGERITFPSSPLPGLQGITVQVGATPPNHQPLNRHQYRDTLSVSSSSPTTPSRQQQQDDDDDDRKPAAASRRRSDFPEHILTLEQTPQRPISGNAAFDVTPIMDARRVGEPLYTTREFEEMWEAVELDVGETTEDIEFGSLVRGANTTVKDSAIQDKAQYGRILPAAMQRVFEHLRLRRVDKFMDYGHGIGNGPLQAAYTVGCESRGIELVEGRNHIATVFQHNLAGQRRVHRERDFRITKPGRVILKHGRLEDPQYRDFLTRVDYNEASSEQQQQQGENNNDDDADSDIVGVWDGNGGRSEAKESNGSSVDSMNDDKAQTDEEEEGHVKVFVNNFNEVFAERCAKPKTSYYLDSFICGLLSTMKPGSKVLTLHELSMLPPSFSKAKKYREERRLEVNANASFYEMEVVEIGPANKSVSWSMNGGVTKQIKGYLYTRIAQEPGQEGNTVILCNEAGCDNARQCIPIPATKTVQIRTEKGNLEDCLVPNSCPCGFEGKVSRRRDCKNPINYKSFAG